MDLVLSMSLFVLCMFLLPSKSRAVDENTEHESLFFHRPCVCTRRVSEKQKREKCALVFVYFMPIRHLSANSSTEPKSLLCSCASWSKIDVTATSFDHEQSVDLSNWNGRMGVLLLLHVSTHMAFGSHFCFLLNAGGRMQMSPPSSTKIVLRWAFFLYYFARFFLPMSCSSTHALFQKFGHHHRL